MATFASMPRSNIWPQTHSSMIVQVSDYNKSSAIKDLASEQQKNLIDNLVNK
jgi:hypothetical protein